jgi:hypothetical protein
MAGSAHYDFMVTVTIREELKILLVFLKQTVNKRFTQRCVQLLCLYDSWETGRFYDSEVLQPPPA